MKNERDALHLLQSFHTPVKSPCTSIPLASRETIAECILETLNWGNCPTSLSGSSAPYPKAMDPAIAAEENANINANVNGRSYLPVRMIEHFLQVEQSFDGLRRDRLVIRSELMGIITDLIKNVMLLYGFAWGWIVVSVLMCGDVRRISYLLAAFFFCGLPLPLAMTLIRLIMKKSHCSHVRYLQLRYEDNLALLEQMMSSLSVEVPDYFDERLKCLRDGKTAKVNVGKHYLFYLLVIVFAIAMGLLIPVIVNRVYNHDPREDDVDSVVSSTILKSILQKIHHRCIPISGSSRDI